MAKKKQELESLQLRRDNVNEAIARFSTFVNAFTDQTNIIELTKRLDKIELQWNEFETCQTKIEEIEPDINNVNIRTDFENVYFKVVSDAQSIINGNNATRLVTQQLEQPVNSSISHNISQQVNLPALSLPRFGGNYNEYTHFHDTFESLINKNTSLDRVQKFHYLISCLEGDALNLVQSLEITASNYNIAWGLLKDRYENKRIIINTHLKSLFELPTLQRENAAALRNFLDSFNKNIRALKSLEQPVDTWDTMLIFLLSSKLDFASKREWESKQKSDNMPKLEDFVGFLNHKCQILETLYARPASHNNTTNPQNTKKSNYNFHKTHEHKSFNNVATENTLKCFYCKKQHYIFYCKQFLNLTEQERNNEVKRLNLCTNCLKPYHNKHSCKGSCKICNRTHNTLLHMKDKITHNTQLEHSNPRLTQSETQTTPVNNANINACSLVDKSLVLLATAVIYIQGPDKQYLQCRALMDGGSQSNFITVNLAKRLGLKLENISFPISGIGETAANISQRARARIKSRDSNYSENASFLVLKTITGNIPCLSFDAAQLSIPNGITLADPNYNESQEIDILLGASIFYNLLTDGQISLGKRQPILQNTQLGWIVTGTLYLQQIQGSHCLLVNNTINIQNQLEKFWILEDTRDTRHISKLTKDEQYCEDHFLQNFTRDETGRFTVALPLKSNYTEIGDTFEMSKRRFLTLEHKLHKNPELFTLYSNFMREYELLGHMTKLNDNEINASNVYYLPHHGVVKPSSTTTKLRVVFDGSAKSTSNISLNDALYVGPTTQDELFIILIRFRKHTYVIKGDITKMYRQVNVRIEHRNLQRILWRDNLDKDIAHFTLNTVTYGTASASFLAIRALQQAAVDNQNTFPKASNIILKDFYVDDLITGADSMHELRQLKADIVTVLSSAGFHLTQWKSNNKNILNSDDQQEKCQFTNDETIKTLGILWNPNNDTFQFSVDFNFNSNKLTKRVVLATISQIFDPLGVIGPVVITAKLILQELWKMKLDWDELIPSSNHLQFTSFFRDLQGLSNIIIPRHILLPTHTHIQLHGFTDASQKAYGACIYVRSVDETGKIYTQLLCSKARVAPLKVISIPRLELCGAVLLARLMFKVVNALNLSIENIFYWTDSSIVLSWIAQESTNWKIFVANRIAEIQDLTDVKMWRHVKSTENPADIVSRGCKPMQLADEYLWWAGPKWLNLVYAQWPTPVTKINLETEILVEKRNAATFSYVETNNNFNLLSKFSKFSKLIRITALCLRFINNSRGQVKEKRAGDLQIFEIEQATDSLIKLVQATEFNKELTYLKTSKELPKNSKVLSLNVFLDKQGIIRVGGRLANSNLAYDQKFPILLPGKHVFTKLIIRSEHERTLHGGVQTVLSAVRAKFWPINAKNTIKGIIRQCITCFKVKPTNVSPMMGQLPEARVKPSRPFNTVGIDFAGPFLIKEGTLRSKKLVKVYVCVLICFSTKAIHLELAGDLSTSTFLSALKRFFARRGLSKTIWSDNGLNFVGAANLIEKAQNKFIELQQDIEIKNFLLENRVMWKFIPPRSPHFGGLWESTVKLVKHHLLRTCGSLCFTYEQFYTILTQIESILNSRPISPLSNDPNDFESLTPGHFLIGARLTSLPEENVQDIPVNRLDKFQQIQRITQTFWQKWSRDYLHNLQQRTKWMINDPNILQIGMMVLLKEDNVNPLQWKCGRISEVHPGRDNINRVFSVKTATGVYKRSFAKLCVLPIDA